jgi:DNA-binding GntR family transcriptional regulator
MLESGSLLTQEEIVNKTYLPARTVRYALTRLKEENLLLRRFYFRDARQSLYGLNSASLEVMTA